MKEVIRLFLHFGQQLANSCRWIEVVAHDTLNIDLIKIEFKLEADGFLHLPILVSFCFLINN
jgi:hypothetical protein